MSEGMSTVKKAIIGGCIGGAVLAGAYLLLNSRASAPEKEAIDSKKEEEEDLIPGNATCPKGGHPLVLGVRQTDWICDQCAKASPKGSISFRCAACGYDECPHHRSGAEEAPREKQKEDEEEKEEDAELLAAAAAGDTAKCKEALANGADVASKDTESGATPLHLAALYNHKATAEFLVAKGAALEATDKKGETPFLWSGKNSAKETAEFLVSKGANFEVRNNKGQTPLILAAIAGRPEGIALLLWKGANLEAADDRGCTALMCAVEYGHKATAEFILSKDANLEAANTAGSTPLHVAAELGRNAIIQSLISKGANLEAATRAHGWTPLSRAAYSGHRDTAEFLVSSGANLEAGEKYGSPLYQAAKNGHRDTAELLVSKGANLEGANEDGRTPLFEAAKNGHTETAELLVFKGAKLEAVDVKGRTPLLVAAEYGHRDTVELLVGKGANLEAVNEDGWTSVLVAVKHWHRDTAELLVSKGANLEDALFVAAEEGQNQVVKFLLIKGANREAVKSNGCTALQLATREGHTDTAEILMSQRADLEWVKDDREGNERRRGNSPNTPLPATLTTTETVPDFGSPKSLRDSGSLAFDEDENVKEREQIREGHYRKIKMVGRGSYGTVYSVLLDNGKTIAMKELLLTPEEFDDQVNEVEKEMAVMREVHHDNVVQYYTACCDPNEFKVQVFMEYITGGSLGSMARQSEQALSEESVKNFIRQAMAGLVHIHRQGIVHRDLKGDNLLLSAGDGLLKLADFGTARSVQGTSRGAQTMIGSPYFMAPELLVEQEGSSEIDYGMKVDVWSMGITVCELLNQGQAPWPFFSNPGQAFLHIARDGNLPLIPEHNCSPLARDFILAACTRDVVKRPTAAALAQHPWLTTDQDTNPLNTGVRSDKNLRDRKTSVNSTSSTSGLTGSTRSDF